MKILKAFPKTSAADQEANKIIAETEKLYRFLRKSNKDLIDKEINQIDIQANLEEKSKRRSKLLKLIDQLDANNVSKDVIDKLHLALNKTDKENDRTKGIVSAKLEICGNIVDGLKKAQMQETIYSQNKQSKGRLATNNIVTKQV